jgi:probable HAF family extracellular repeat protein
MASTPIPHDLSDRGDVVGDIYGLDESQGMFWSHYPFWWSHGEWRQISSDNIAGRGGLDVNRRGQVVTRRDAPPYAGVWVRGEVMLPPPGFGAQRINDRGQVMGRVQNEAGENEAATWRLGDDRMTRLGTLGGDYSEGVVINERGDIAGNSATVDGEEHGFLWRNGEMIDLGTLGGVRSWVADLNDRGDVVGTSITAEGEGHAFLWRDGEMIDLGSLGATDSYPASEAVAINNHGQVVGHASDHVFLWENGRMTDIGVLADESRSRPVDINDRGQILGWASFDDWPTAAVLWTAPPRRG